MNFEEFLRTPSLKNTSEQLLLQQVQLLLISFTGKLAEDKKSNIVFPPGHVFTSIAFELFFLLV